MMMKRFKVLYMHWTQFLPFFPSLVIRLISMTSTVVYVVAQLSSSGLLFLRLLPSSPLKEVPPPRLNERDR